MCCFYRDVQAKQHAFCCCHFTYLGEHNNRIIDGQLRMDVSSQIDHTQLVPFVLVPFNINYNDCQFDTILEQRL